jgi:hypothetical protein
LAGWQFALHPWLRRARHFDQIIWEATLVEGQ